MYGIEPVELLAGGLPKRQHRLVEAWAELHQTELTGGLESVADGTESITYCSAFLTVDTMHPIYRVNRAEILAPYTLRVTFDDNTEQTIDFRPILSGELFRPLRDLTIFNQVRVDPEVHTLVWPNGADFDPATLHDWPEHRAELISRAREWDRLSA